MASFQNEFAFFKLFKDCTVCTVFSASLANLSPFAALYTLPIEFFVAAKKLNPPVTGAKIPAAISSVTISAIVPAV